MNREVCVSPFPTYPGVSLRGRRGWCLRTTSWRTFENPLRFHTTRGASNQQGTILDKTKSYILEGGRGDDTLLSSVVKRPCEPWFNLDFVRERELGAMLEEGAAAVPR